MNDIIYISISLLIGLFVGIIFFVGLWLTIRTGVQSEHPAILFLGSLLLRTTIVLLGFYFVAVALNKYQPDHQLSRLISCFLGFLLVRFFVTKTLRRGVQNAH